MPNIFNNFIEFWCGITEFWCNIEFLRRLLLNKVYLNDGIGNPSTKQNNANVWFALRSIHERLKSLDWSVGAFIPNGSEF